MSLFANIEESNDIKESGDVLGGGAVRDSGIVDFTVKNAYVQPAASGAIGVVLTLVDDNGVELRSTEYITSGREKGGKNFYERNGEKHFLPGFTLINDLALLTTGQSLTALEPQIEEKVVPIYNFEAQKEVPTKVPVIMPLIGQKVKAGVLRVTEDKSKKADDGKYYPTGETREKNELNKLFHAETGMTVTEYKAKAEEASFMQAWADKNTGRVVDKTSKDGAKAPAAMKGAGTPAAGAPARPSLFGNK